MKKIIITALTAGVICLSLTSCNNTNNNETGSIEEADTSVAGYSPYEWEDDPTVGKVQAGYYRRVGISKSDASYEENLELLEIGQQGYLTVREDGTATFELDGEKTEYTYDKYNFYYAEDTERVNGITYVYIGGRLIVDDGTTITQYLKLSDEELNNGQ